MLPSRALKVALIKFPLCIFPKPRYEPMSDRGTNHNASTECGPHINVSDAGIDVHTDRLTVMHKYLFQEHSVDLARFDVCVWYEVTFRTVGTGPA